MSAPTFWDFLARSSDELIAMGAPRRDVVDRRFAATGHVRPICPRWFSSYGGWGGVLDVDELAERVGVERQVVIDYAKAKGLRYATRACRRTHGELAILLWVDRARSPEESCKFFGVYPVERRVLCAAAQVLIDEADDGIDTVLRWTLAELDRRFAKLKVMLRPPAQFFRSEGQAPSEWGTA